MVAFYGREAVYIRIGRPRGCRLGGKQRTMQTGCRRKRFPGSRFLRPAASRDGKRPRTTRVLFAVACSVAHLVHLAITSPGDNTVLSLKSLPPESPTLLLIAPRYKVAQDVPPPAN